MKVSVITICHNSEKFIAHTIQSVLSQTHSDIEYIIVDGNSDDSTPEIIRSYLPAISKWVSEPDEGLYDAMNKGIGMASGDVIGFLHSDDFFIDEKVIEKLSDVFEHENPDSVYGDIQYVDEHDFRKVLTNRKYGKCRLWKFKLGWSPPHSAFYVKREVFEKLGKFDTSFSIAADYDWILRILVKYKKRAVYIPEVLVRMRVGGVSNRTMKNVRKKWREDKRAMKINGFGSPLTLFFKIMRPVAHFINSPRYLFE